MLATSSSATTFIQLLTGSIRYNQLSLFEYLIEMYHGGYEEPLVVECALQGRVEMMNKLVERGAEVEQVRG